ncbi:peptide deformylase, mitochondrial-like [Acipenser oxyrinchus oxyrinchus]|uniref:Peptide deformylase n=1 Tax=Acipenser oxyrinchus oxyrinchus TaxID=40147 RepID=A0AAD8D2K1_ACIOX|nr:peptide deformylase, mitochondrial-like [Acipenser oxyrinchus oxyrinchus]
MTSLGLSRSLCRTLQCYTVKRCIPVSGYTCKQLRVICNPCAPATRSHSSEIKQRTYWQYLKRKVMKSSLPPYQHVCQVGDPVLRSKASPVDPVEICSPQVQKVIQTLIKVMRKLDCMGLSAPQIGVSLQVIALEFTERMLHENPLNAREIKGLAPFPLKIFVNPSVRVLDSRTATFVEGCESVSGFSACVPRFHSVEISGLNESGEPVSWQTSGWPARIIQHEMDHLNGVLYIDKMDSKTFANVSWMELNE